MPGVFANSNESYYTALILITDRPAWTYFLLKTDSNACFFLRINDYMLLIACVALRTFLRYTLICRLIYSFGCLWPYGKTIVGQCVAYVNLNDDAPASQPQTSPTQPTILPSYTKGESRLGHLVCIFSFAFSCPLGHAS